MAPRVVRAVLVMFSVTVVELVWVPERVRSEAPPRVEEALIVRVLARVRAVPSPASVPPPRARVEEPRALLWPTMRVPAVSEVVPV